MLLTAHTAAVNKRILPASGEAWPFPRPGRFCCAVPAIFAAVVQGVQSGSISLTIAVTSE